MTTEFSNKIFTLLRFITIVFWLTVIASPLIDNQQTITDVIQILAAVILLAHVLEIFVYRQVVQQAPNKSTAIINILIFGLFWILPHKNAHL